MMQDQMKFTVKMYVEQTNRAIRLAIVCVILVLQVAVLKNFPVNHIHFISNTIYLSFLVIFYFLYCVNNFFVNLRLRGLDIIFFSAIAVMFVSAFKSYLTFDQPFLYGIFVQRSILLSLSSIFLLHLLHKNTINIFDIENSFIILSHTLLILYLFFYLFIDAGKYVKTSFTSFSPVKGYRYRFENFLIVMLLFYAIIKLVLEKKWIFIGSFVLAIVYLFVFYQGRIVIFSTAITIIVFFTINIFLKQKGPPKLYTVYVFLLLGLLIYLFPQLIQKHIKAFGNVVSLLSGNEVREPSVYIRFHESIIAIEGFKNNILFGTGRLSFRWEEGYKSLFNYFYPSDIGLLGNLYIYGIIGTMIFYIPFIAVAYWSKKIRGIRSTLLITAEYTLLYLFIKMLFSAHNISSLGMTYFPFIIVYYFYNQAEPIQKQE